MTCYCHRQDRELRRRRLAESQIASHCLAQLEESKVNMHEQVQRLYPLDSLSAVLLMTMTGFWSTEGVECVFRTKLILLVTLPLKTLEKQIPCHCSGWLLSAAPFERETTVRQICGPATFKLELTSIMRQKDIAFASLLNHLRKHSRLPFTAWQPQSLPSMWNWGRELCATQLCHKQAGFNTTSFASLPHAKISLVCLPRT